MTKMFSGLADLGREVAASDAGFRTVRGPGGFALLPETAKDIDEWERRSIALHQSQEPVSLAPKPSANQQTNGRGTHGLAIFKV
jgi:hypothetical protein